MPKLLGNIFTKFDKILGDFAQKHPVTLLAIQNNGDRLPRWNIFKPKIPIFWRGLE
jgi:hypothetical protein